MLGMPCEPNGHDDGIGTTSLRRAGHAGSMARRPEMAVRATPLAVLNEVPGIIRLMELSGEPANRIDGMMRRSVVSLAAMVLMPCCAPARATDAYPFDGRWQTTVSCAAARDALGYSFRFISEVKNGSFRGLHGVEGQSGSLLITGTIAPDGTG